MNCISAMASTVQHLNYINIHSYIHIHFVVHVHVICQLPQNRWIRLNSEGSVKNHSYVYSKHKYAYRTNPFCSSLIWRPFHLISVSVSFWFSPGLCTAQVWHILQTEEALFLNRTCSMSFRISFCITYCLGIVFFLTIQERAQYKQSRLFK